MTSKKIVKDLNIIPKNPIQWQSAFINDSVYIYNNNLEIGKVDFFKDEKVVNFTNAIIQSGGIYKYRWGDAGLRYLTIALFASEDEVMSVYNIEFGYCHPYNWTENSHQF